MWKVPTCEGATAETTQIRARESVLAMNGFSFVRSLTVSTVSDQPLSRDLSRWPGFAVVLDMVLFGFIAVKDRVLCVAMRDLRFLNRHRVIFPVAVLGG